MKKIISLILSISLVSIGLQAQVYTEQADGLRNEDYETFAFLDQSKSYQKSSKEMLIIDSPSMRSIWVYNDPAYPSPDVKKQIERSIKQEMISEGFKMDDKDADLLVSYIVFSKDGTLKGNYRDEDQLPNMQTVEEYEVDRGTLFVSIADKESGEIVWQGFHKGAFSGKQQIQEDEAITAVVSILDRLVLNTF
jgi:hypothetical protein